MFRRPPRGFLSGVAAAGLLVFGVGLLGYAAASEFLKPPAGAAPEFSGLTANATPAGGNGYTAALTVTNVGRWPAEVVGGTFGCRFGGCVGCDSPARFPLPAGGSAEIALTGDRWRPGPFEEEVTLYVAHAGALHDVPLTIRGDLPPADGAFMDDARFAELRTRLGDD